MSRSKRTFNRDIVRNATNFINSECDSDNLGNYSVITSDSDEKVYDSAPIGVAFSDSEIPSDRSNDINSNKQMEEQKNDKKLEIHEELFLLFVTYNLSNRLMQENLKTQTLFDMISNVADRKRQKFVPYDVSFAYE